MHFFFSLGEVGGEGGGTFNHRVLKEKPLNWLYYLKGEILRLMADPGYHMHAFFFSLGEVGGVGGGRYF